MTDPFENAEIIDAYSDSQAVEDGVLIDISSLRLSFRGHPVNRMTATLYEACTPFVVAFKGDEHPVPAVKGDHEWDYAFARMFRIKLSLAVAIDDGIKFQLPGGGDDGPIWCVFNELGGFTLMFASDY